MNENKITYQCVTVPNLDRMKRNLSLILPYVDEAVLVIGKKDYEAISYFKTFPQVTVLYREWDDARAKQYQVGLNHINEGWVLILDDDEVPTEGVLKSLRSYIAASDNGLRFDAVAFQVVDIDETGLESKNYQREVFYKWNPNLHYTIDSYHCSLIGLQKNVKSEEIIYHSKTRKEQLTSSFYSYWETGVWADHKDSFEFWYRVTGQDPRFFPGGPLIPNSEGLAYPLRDGFKTDSWKELRSLVRKHHPEAPSFNTLIPVVADKKLHPSIVAWAERNNEHNDTRPHLAEQHAIYKLLTLYGYYDES